MTAAAPSSPWPLIAAPADMKVGNVVSGSARRATSPPSWSIGTMTGKPRSPPASCSAWLNALTSSSGSLVVTSRICWPVTMTPAKCLSRTSASDVSSEKLRAMMS